MNVLVTGGAGFIGSNLIARLLDLSHSVVSIDNYISGIQENHHANAEYVAMCVSGINQLNFDADVVFHLGEYSRVEQSDVEPWKCLQNTYRTLPAVLEYCVKRKAKLIYSGSSTKFSETTNPYIAAKKLNTHLVRTICEQYGCDYAITYFYNVYGINEICEGKYATVVAKFIKAKQEGKSVRITGTGEQKRNFTHVNDIVDGLLLVADKGHGDHYGIGSNESYSILKLAQIVGVDYEFVEDKPSNRKNCDLITHKTLQLGWFPTRSLQNYIAERLGA